MSDELLKQILNELQSVKTEIGGVKQSLARMEQDHGTKLSALLDGYKQNALILDRHTEQLDRIEDRVTHHDIKISILDKTKSNKRIAKAK